MIEFTDSGETRIIVPVDFHERTGGGPRSPGPSAGRWIARVLLTLVIGASAAAGWFLFTACRVQLDFEPPAERVEVVGRLPQLELGGKRLLRPGTYAVRATLDGHQPFEANIDVARGQDNIYSFELQELPGILAIRCVRSDERDSALADVEVHVGDVLVGRTPLADVELHRGRHALRLECPRYRTLETQLEVDGLGRHQEVAIEMHPDWALVEIASTPVGATVVIDGATVSRTPCQVELLSGTHTLELTAPRFKDWTTTLQIVAEQPLSMTDIVLEPAPGRLIVSTSPAGAQVTVESTYAGVSPLEAAAPPDRDILVHVARDGYEPAQRTVRVGPAETTTVAFDLTPQYGTIQLVVDPPGALLSVDGAPWGVAEPEITLPAVTHQLEFTLDGYEPATRTVRPRPDIRERITVSLQPTQAETTPGPDPLQAANSHLLALIEPAAFTMGSSRREQGRRSNEALRQIKLERSFVMGVREVTNEQYTAFDPQHDSGVVAFESLNLKNRPVVQVRWDDAARYCNWLSAQDQLPAAYIEVNGHMRAVEPMTIGYRLPTEAEWAYVARVAGNGKVLKYPWGERFPPTTAVGNYADASASAIINRRIDAYDDDFPVTAPVGSFEANHHGAYDMGGNVSEWCHDLYMIYTYDTGSAMVDPLGPTTGKYHVVRGSSWRHASMSMLRLAYRDYDSAPRDDLGFRICRYVPEENTTNDTPKD